MAGYQRQIQTGPAGTTWTNDTPRVAFQFYVAGINTCGTCYQYSEAVSNGPWPIPLHHGCRCRQSAVAPGAEAPRAFTDFREDIAALPHDQQVAVLGASAYKLLEAGVIKWTDVVTESRVRTLREVVSLKGLTVKRMTDAGVRPRWANEAHQAVNTPAHIAADAARRAGLARLQAAGLKQDAIVAELSARIAARVSVAEGATYTTKAGEVLRGIAAHRMPGPGGSNAAELAKLLGAYLAVKRVRAKPKPKPPPEEPPPPAAAVVPAPPPGPPPWKPGTAIDPDRPIGERIERAPHLQAKLDAILAIRTEFKKAEEAVEDIKRQIDIHNQMVRFGEIEGGEAHTGLSKLEAKLRAADDLRFNLQNAVRGKVSKAINISKLDAQSFEHHDGVGDWSEDDIFNRASANRTTARQWLEHKLHESETPHVTIKWEAQAGIRANATAGGTINVSKDDWADVHIHEIGHQIDYQIPSVRHAVVEFLDHRVGSQQPRKLNEIEPASSYRDDELGRDDDFAKAFGKNSAWYVGKKYPEQGVTEVLSMGLQKLYDDPTAFAKNDPEYCKFVLGILDGSLRKPYRP